MHAGEQSRQFTKRQVFLALVAVFAVYGTSAYFVQTINIARPKMAADLDGMALYSWSVSIPSLVGAFVALIFGKFSDIYGRRIILVVSLSFFLLGSILSAVSQTFVFLIFANAVARMGSGSLMMLCYAVLGDLFPPLERSKWVGMMNLPGGFFALVGPTMGGWFVDNQSWRHLYWIAAPMIVLCVGLVLRGVPVLGNKIARKIDVLGSLLVIIASSTAILGFSFAGTTYPWSSVQVIGLLGTSLLFWVLFLLAETGVAEPILEPQLLRNRSFVTVAAATFLCIFGQMAMTLYFPLFLQGVQSISATRSGHIITPYSVLMAFLGVPVGFLLARTKRYKWMYIVSFGILTLDMFGVIFFTAATPVPWSFMATTLAGVGLGAIPTVNTMVVQNAVPRRLLGAVMGAIFFTISMGLAVAPAILGSAMNVSYSARLASTLPQEVKGAANQATMTTLGNPRVLLSEPAMTALEAEFNKRGSQGRALYQKTVESIRVSMEAGLRSIFWIAAIAMLIAFLLISTVPEVSFEHEIQEKEVAKSVGQSAGS